MHWGALVVRDNDESIYYVDPLQPPGELTVTTDYYLSAKLDWEPSTDDDGQYLDSYYEIYRRLSHLDDWGTPIEKFCQGVSFKDESIPGPLVYDYAVRYVNGQRRSGLSIAENIDNFDYQAPDQLSHDDLAATPGNGYIKFEIYNFPLWAYSVEIFQYSDNR